MRHSDVTQAVEVVVGGDVGRVGHAVAEERVVGVHVLDIARAEGLEEVVERHVAVGIRRGVGNGMEGHEENLGIGRGFLNLVDQGGVVGLHGGHIGAARYVARARIYHHGARALLAHAFHLGKGGSNHLLGEGNRAAPAPTGAAVFDVGRTEEFLPLAALHLFVAEEEDVV